MYGNVNEIGQIQTKGL